MAKSTKKCGHRKIVPHCLICHMSRIGGLATPAQIAARRKNMAKARAAKNTEKRSTVSLTTISLD